MPVVDPFSHFFNFLLRLLNTGRKEDIIQSPGKQMGNKVLVVERRSLLRFSARERNRGDQRINFRFQRRRTIKERQIGNLWRRITDYCELEDICLERQ